MTAAVAQGGIHSLPGEDLVTEPGDAIYSLSMNRLLSECRVQILKCREDMGIQFSLHIHTTLYTKKPLYILYLL